MNARPDLSRVDLLALLPGPLHPDGRTNGGEFKGPCPWCGGTDRFIVWPNHPSGRGRYWCRQCRKGGDAITFLREGRGMGYFEALAALGIAEEGSSTPRPGASLRIPRPPTPPRPAAPALPSPEEAVARVKAHPVFSKALGVTEADLWSASPITPRSDVDETAHAILALYRPGEFVNVMPEATATAKGKLVPWGKGITKTREEWDAYLREHPAPCHPQAGAWLRMNPTNGEGNTAEHIAAFRHVLLEADELPPECQLAIIASLPSIAMVLSSGGRSHHAWVRVDKPDAKSYCADAKTILDAALAPFGIDHRNGDVARLSRLPGVMRGDRKQKLLYLDRHPGTESILAKLNRRKEDAGPRCRLHPRDLVLRVGWNGFEVTATGGRLTLTPGPSAKGGLPDWLSSALREREAEIAAYLASLPPEPNPENLGAEAAIRRFLEHSACRVEGGDVEAEAEAAGHPISCNPLAADEPDDIVWD